MLNPRLGVLLAAVTTPVLLFVVLVVVTAAIRNTQEVPACHHQASSRDWLEQFGVHGLVPAGERTELTRVVKESPL